MAARPGVIAAVVVVVGAQTAFIAYQHQKLSEQSAKLQANKSSEQVSLSDGTVRASTTVTQSGGAAVLAQSEGADLAAVRRDAAALGAAINAMVAAKAQSVGRRETGLASTQTEYRKSQPGPIPSSEAPPGEDKWGYTKSKQELRLTEPFLDGKEMPVGTVGFSAWKQGPWDVALSPRTYESYTVGTVDEDGNRKMYSQLVVEVDGEKYKLPISKSSYAEDEAPKRWNWQFLPMLTLSMGPWVKLEDGTAVLPGGEIGLLRYGVPRQSADWTFLAFGVGYDPRVRAVAAVVTPVSYNVGKPLPLVDNMFLGPMLGVQVNGAYTVGLSLQVGL